MVCDPLKVLLNSVCKCLVEDVLHLCLSGITACNFLCVVSLSGFGSRITLASQNEFESISYSSFFLEEFGKGAY